jgi:cell division protein FtsW (lipid II flippase)
MLCLMVVGVVFVYSAGYRGEDQPDAGFHRRQIVWCVIGVGVFVGAAVADYRRVGAQAAGL